LERGLHTDHFLQVQLLLRSENDVLHQLLGQMVQSLFQQARER
jgi:hypothetical protein